MGGPVKISLVCLILLTSKVGSQHIIPANDDVDITLNEDLRAIMYMNENNHDFDDGTQPHTLLFDVIVEPPDKPIFQFISGMFFDAEFVSDDNIRWHFYAKQSFDYEQNQRTYQFNVRFGSAYPLVLFNITNIDDEPPTLTSPQCNFTENNIYTVENSDCSCILSDPDGWLSLTTFDIVPNRGGEEDIFALEFRETPDDEVTSANVYLTVREELNYQSVTFYLFDIHAQDSAHHNTTPNSLVRAMIDVTDLPDTAAEWIDYFTVEQVTEQTERTFTITAVDGDHGLNNPIIYQKLWEDEDENYISIDQNGIITVRNIDRDKNDISAYHFAIMALAEEHDLIFNSTLTITLYVDDIDNNPPLVRWVRDGSNRNVSFDDTTDKVTSLSFEENYDGNLNLSIFVQDIDTGENAQFSVELEDLPDSSEEYTAAFMIVPTAGYRSGEFQIAVRNATYLDYEIDEWINIKFNVLTRGTLDRNKLDRMLVNITLINYNDELPIFEETEYEISINETAKIGEFIIQIMATDRDAEDYILSHSLVGSTYTNRVLDIEEDTGRISVKTNNAFDYDTVNPIFVQVRATDKADHRTTVPLTINLLDVNNKAPTISVGDPINVDENQMSFTVLNSSITATDMDTTADLSAEIDWDRSYAMKNSRRLDMTNETISQQVKFIDAVYRRENENDDTNKDIIISLVVNDNNPDETTPDYELFDSLYVALKVTDWNTDPEFMAQQNTSVIILISINDINDNTPFFPEADLPENERENRTVQEYAPRGTSVGTIIAIDLDVDDTVTYACTAPDLTFDWLDINPRTGAFTVKDDNLIDADTYKTFYFQYSCTASDNNDTHTSEPLTVNFYIIDTNNKIPEISIDSELYVDEKSPPATIVSHIGTTDADRDMPFHTVACSFTERTGPCFDSFTIENNVLTVRYGGEDIDRDEKLSFYDCDMTCQDNPDRLQNDQNPHSVLKTFRINLNDINDHTPEVLTKEFSSSENTKQEDLIGIILATDIDEGDNAEIDFSITQVVNAVGEDIISDLFGIVTDDNYRVNLTHKQANLIALEDLKGQYGTYTLSVLVADRGTPPNSDTYEVTLVVDKFNFEAPRFIYPANDDEPITLLTTQQIGSQLVLFRSQDSEYLQNFYASDTSASDVCEKWDIEFSFEQTSPEENTIFALSKIGPCSTQLQVNTNYNADYVIRKTFNLQLTASVSDGEPQEGEAPYTASRSIVINFLDNNQKPEFSVREWTFSFFEDNASQTIELEHKASYDIVDERPPIFYYLVTEDETIASLFAVDATTGTVSLKDKLVYQSEEPLTFQIVASNDTTPTSNNANSYLDVYCNVIEINNHVPQWKRDSFFGALMSGYIRNTPILDVEATDEDTIDRDKLTYFIDGTITSAGSGLNNIPPDAFVISQTTGEVRLNFQVDNTMSGYFEFDVIVWDVVDPYGNGPHSNTTRVTIFIITEDNTVNFRFYNTIEEVQDEELEMLEIVSNVLGYNAYKQNIDRENQNGEELNNQTFASLYFINDTNIQAIEKDTILRLVSDINIFTQLVVELRNQTGLMLASFPSTSTGSNNLEEVLRAWLVGVSVVLGALCLILLVTFILKTRELNNRITNLTMRKFGSQESGLNRLGISAPTTNKHAIEGSNPIFNLSSDDIKKDLREFDEVSMRSGDSDLIGIEDSPEFDYGDKTLNDTNQHI